MYARVRSRHRFPPFFQEDGFGPRLAMREAGPSFQRARHEHHFRLFGDPNPLLKHGFACAGPAFGTNGSASLGHPFRALRPDRDGAAHGAPGRTGGFAGYFARLRGRNDYRDRGAVGRRQDDADGCTEWTDQAVQGRGLRCGRRPARRRCGAQGGAPHNRDDLPGPRSDRAAFGHRECASGLADTRHPLSLLPWPQRCANARLWPWRMSGFSTAQRCEQTGSRAANASASALRARFCAALASCSAMSLSLRSIRRSRCVSGRSSAASSWQRPHGRARAASASSGANACRQGGWPPGWPHGVRRTGRGFRR